MPFVLYSLPLFFSTVVLTGLGCYSLWRLRSARIIPFALSMFLAATWTLTIAFDILIPGLPEKIFWYKVRFSALALLTPVWLVMVAGVVGRAHLTRGVRWILLMLVPSVTLVLTWTGDYHSLLRYNFSLNRETPFLALQFSNGPWFYVHAAYNYLLGVAAIIILIEGLRGPRTVYYRQALIILTCTLLPSMMDLLLFLNLSPVRGYNLAPYTFCIAAPLLGWALLRYRLFDLTPVARSLMMETVRDVVMVVDNHRRLLDVNPAGQEIFGLNTATAIGKNLDDLFGAYPALIELLDSNNGQADFSLERNGRVYSYELTSTPLPDGPATTSGRLYHLRDITLQKLAGQQLREANERLQTKLEEIELLQTRLREEAIRDHLTGLFNRRYLEETLAQELALAARHNWEVSVVILDLDLFKNINDNYGHKGGDEMLQALGELLRSQTRSSDTACRYGGEEFALVMPEMNLETAVNRTEQLRSVFEKLVVDSGGHSMQATLSAGIAVYPQHGSTVEELTQHADRALYAAKAAGRNCVRAYPGHNIVLLPAIRQTGQLNQPAGATRRNYKLPDI